MPTHRGLTGFPVRGCTVPGLPSRPGALRARRRGSAIQVALPPIAGASRYTVSAKLTDGHELGYDLAASCRTLAIPAPVDIGATVRVAGVRYDMATGAGRRISLAGNALTAGPRRKLPPRFWRARKICR